MRAFNVPKAKEMFLNMVKWREDFGVDAIVKVNSCAIKQEEISIFTIKKKFLLEQSNVYITILVQLNKKKLVSLVGIELYKIFIRIICYV